MKRTRLLTGAVLPLLLALSCAHAPASTAGTDEAPLVSAEKTAESQPTATNLGRAALTTWIVNADAARAEQWAAKAVALDAAEPLALYTRLLIAREALDDAAVVKAAVALIRQAPQHPVTELAVSRLRELVNLSPSTDALINEALSGLDNGSLKLEGHAAFRAREVLAALREGHNDDDGLARVRETQGTPSAWSVVGPLQALRLRDFNKVTPLDDPKHVLSGSYGSVLGGTRTRTFVTPAGLLDLEPDTWGADIFEAFSDVTVEKGGRYLVSARGSNAVVVLVDGVSVVRRDPLPSRPPERSWGVVELPAGRHRIHVKLARVDSGWITLTMARDDGAPSDLKFEAARIGAAPPSPAAKAGTATAWGASAKAETGLIERYLAIQQALLDDGDAARVRLEALLKTFPESPTLRGLDADLAGTDADLPRPNVVSRVAQDLDAILKATPNNARATLGRFQQERGEKRYDEATVRLARLMELVGPSNARVLIEASRFSLDRGDASQARMLAEKALKEDGGRCDAIALRAELARRDGEAKLTEELVPKLVACPGGLGAMTTFLRARLKFAETLPYLQRMLARTPSSVAARRSLADALHALGKTDEAAAVLEPLVDLWPHESEPLKRQAAYRALDGDVEEAHKLTKQALAVEGGDLTTARSLALEQHADVLDWAARDGLAVIDAFQKADFHPPASAIQVLDLGVLDIQSDGSTLERVQSVVQVLDKKGINQFGEVNIPGDAQPLMVRTVKANGKILDAEIINGKESISLPNLEPGDFVEYAFLRASGPRPAATPGWQGGQFTFRGEDVPFFESTYVVRAPASIGIELDADNLEPPAAVVREGDFVRMTYSRRQSPAYVREPLPVPDPEVLPWLEAGAGAGQEAALTQYADWLPLRTRVTPLLREFIQGTDTLPPLERVKVIVDRLRALVKGESSTMDFSDTATTVLHRTRGNRLLALKAALAAAGVSSHLVVARPFIDYAHEFRFPHPGVFRSAVLRIEVPGQAPMWMDFALRTAPLNQLPSILSGQAAYVIPNDANESVTRIQLPDVNPENDRTDTVMDLAIDAEGTLTGTIQQTAFGFDAATLRWRLEQVNATELRKQQERVLSGAFQGLTLVDFAVEDSGVAGEPLTARSTIRVPRFTNRGAGVATILSNFGAFKLGPRYVRVGERQTPMLMAVDDLNRNQVTLKLPSGMKPELPSPVVLDTPFGRYNAKWSQEGDKLSFREELLVKRGRVAPADYGAFKAFAAAVDGAQSRQIKLAAREAEVTRAFAQSTAR